MERLTRLSFERRRRVWSAQGWREREVIEHSAFNRNA